MACGRHLNSWTYCGRILAKHVENDSSFSWDALGKDIWTYMENGLFFTFTLRLIYMENDSSSHAYLDLFTWKMILLHTHALDVDINQGFTFWNSTKSHPFA